jgi:hypothetical protein
MEAQGRHDYRSAVPVISGIINVSSRRAGSVLKSENGVRVEAVFSPLSEII